MIIHGGPAGVFSQSYTGNPGIYMIEYLASKGYAIIRPNPRGSTGYGKEFRYANFKDTICYKCTQQEKITPAGPRLNSLQAVEGIEPGKIVFLQVSFSAFCNFNYCTCCAIKAS